MGAAVEVEVALFALRAARFLCATVFRRFSTARGPVVTLLSQVGQS